MKADKLYLVGFMGAGKTTVARALGKRTGWRVEDIDERIEARERRTVAAIFAQQGEAYFRQLERQALGELLPVRTCRRRHRRRHVRRGGQPRADAGRRRRGLARSAARRRSSSACPPMAGGRWRPTAPQMEQLYARRQLAYAHAHVRIDATRPVPEVVERLLEWIEY